MKISKTQKGITIIALIITILILVILAAVSIAAIKNDGIIGHAQDKKDKYDQLAQEKNELLKDHIDYINNESVGGNQEDGKDEESNNKNEESTDEGTTDNGNAGATEDDSTYNDNILDIGEYVDYKYDTKNSYVLEAKYSGYESDQVLEQTKNLKWQYLGVNKNGKHELISEISTNKVYFQGPYGYNNGVFLLNDICKTLYSNNTLGIVARSFNINDIEGKFVSNFSWQSKDTHCKDYLKLGEERVINNDYYTSTPVGGNKCPILYYDKELASNFELDLSNDGYSSYNELPQKDGENYLGGFTNVESFRLKNTGKFKGFYSFDFKDGEPMLNLLFGADTEYISNPSYRTDWTWLATRFSSLDSPSAKPEWGLQAVDSNGGTEQIGTKTLCMISGNHYNDAEFGWIRIVVELPSELDITASGEEKGSASNPWKLTK